MDIHLSPSTQNYTQSESDKDSWNNIYADNGNDIIQIYNGQVIVGTGNDTIKKISTPDSYRTITVAYLSLIHI